MSLRIATRARKIFRASLVTASRGTRLVRSSGAVALALVVGGTLASSCSPPPARGLVETERSTGPPPEGEDSAQLLFRSDFESAITIHAPTDCWDKGCWQDARSTDTATPFTWPPKILGGDDGRFQLITDPVSVTPASIGDYMLNRVETVIGHDGDETRALYQEIARNVNGTDPMGTSVAQNSFQILPTGETSDLYVSYMIKFQPDLARKMSNLPPGPGVRDGGTWRAFFAFKTGPRGRRDGSADDGDYRVEVYVTTYGGGPPYWAALGDNEAGGDAPLVNDWTVVNRSVPVPIGRWFRFEIFWHRSKDSDGRIWVAVDGQTIVDRCGPNMGAWNLPVNRIIAPLLYSGSYMPIYQWVDDLEIWDGFPPAGSRPVGASGQ